jgi:RNA polymerase-binding transcription factor DksA
MAKTTKTATPAPAAKATKANAAPTTTAAKAGSKAAAATSDTKAAPAAKPAPAAKTGAKAPAKAGAATAAGAKAAQGKTPAAKVPAAKPAAAAAKPAKAAKAPFDKKFLDAQRNLLLEERARYVRSADSLRAEADALMEGREPGDVQFDEESGEGDSLAVERERDLALSAQARAAVEEIDAALARLDNGTYGICQASGEPIPRERLEAIPWATVRVEYKAGSFFR